MVLMPRPGVASIAPYVPGRTSVAGATDIVKLSSNESALGPSAKAITAFQSAAGKLHRYPDGAATGLREAIGARYRIAPEKIICGAGSDELLTLTAIAFAGPGDEVLYSEHGFLVYPIAARTAGATPVTAPETNLTADVDALLARVTKATKIVYLANPNNPTGTYLTSAELRRLHAGLPENVLLVIDAAYTEYVRRNDYEDGLALAADAPNVLVTRTFSKVFGLAALRIGWATGPAEVIDAINRIRGPFNVSIPAQLAGVAALEDEAHVEKSVSLNEAERARLTAALTTLGYQVLPSVANFVLLKFKDADQAKAADLYLGGQGLILRSVAAYGLSDCLRLTIGLPEENDRVIKALSGWEGRN